MSRKDEVKRSSGDASFHGLSAFPDESRGIRGFPDEALRSSALPRSSALFPEPEVYRSLPSQGVASPLPSSGLSDPVFRSISSSSDLFSIPPPSSLQRPQRASKSLDEAVRQKPSSSGKSLPQIIPSFSAPLLPIDVEPPPVPGGYLEPSSHFFSRANPQLLLRELKLAMDGMESEHIGRIDITISAPKFKLTCVAYKPGELSLPFMARVFRIDPDSDGKRYALELQRRSGDALHFWEIWSSTKRYFQAKGLLESSKPIPPPARRPIPHLDVEVTPEQIQSTVKCLIEMASSEFADVKSQAIQALSKMTVADARTLQLMVSEDCLETLLKSISSKLEDEHRCAVSALANLGHNCAPVCKSIAAKGGVKSLCSLVGSSVTPQVHRECSRVLRSIAVAVGVSMVDQEVRQTVHSLSCSQDVYVRQQAGHLVELLHL